MERERTAESSAIRREDESCAKMTVGGLDEIESTEEHKVLGSNWNLAMDTLVLKLDKVVEFGRNLEPTKILSESQRSFSTHSD